MNRDPKGNPQPPPSSSSSSSSTGPGSLADSAKKNRSQLGDPVSLRSEYSNTQPTEQDLGADSEAIPQASQGNKQGGKSKDQETLSEKALKNPTALGDPVSLKAESSTLVPTEEEKSGSVGSKRDSKI